MGRVRYTLATAMGIAVLSSPVQLLAQRPLGIDVSYFQGNLSQANWDSIFASGRTFAFVRCAHFGGSGGEPDPYFPTNMSRARTAGLMVGAYHFARPSVRDPATEASYFLNYATQYWNAQRCPTCGQFGPNFINTGFLRPVLDAEEGGGGLVVGPNNTQITLAAWANQWMDIVKQQSGVDPIVYCSSYYAQHYLSGLSTATHPLWIANSYCPGEPPPGSPPGPFGPWSTWTFWQYCVESAGSVPGIAGDIDVDVFNGTTAQLQTYLIPTFPPMIALSTNSLTRTVFLGSTLASDIFTVSDDTSSTRNPLNYSISDNVSWLSVTPTSGSSSGAANPHTINYSTIALSAGHYTGTITITAAGATNTPQQLAIDLTVEIPGDIDGDGDADLIDFAFLQRCLGSPLVVAPPECSPADFNADTHVDQNDVSIFVKCASGADIGVTPGCNGP